MRIGGGCLLNKPDNGGDRLDDIIKYDVIVSTHGAAGEELTHQSAVICHDVRRVCGAAVCSDITIKTVIVQFDDGPVESCCSYSSPGCLWRRRVTGLFGTVHLWHTDKGHLDWVVVSLICCQWIDS